MTEPRETSLLFYDTGAGAVRVEVVYRDESFWLSQKAMAELFSVGIPAIKEEHE